MDKLKLGQKVRFTAVLKRRRVEVSNPKASAISRFKTRWEDHWLEEASVGEGVLVGYRDQQNGYREWEGAEVGNIWIRTGTVRCALVATSLYRNPVRVPLERLEVADV